MRKRRAVKRDVLADPMYNSKLVTKLINRLMVDGKKGKAQTILYKSFDRIISTFPSSISFSILLNSGLSSFEIYPDTLSSI